MNVEKPQLVTTEGLTFEKGIVVDILRDNLPEDGSRTGEEGFSLIEVCLCIKNNEIAVSVQMWLCHGCCCLAAAPDGVVHTPG